jgi:hypothetical protein
MSVSQLRDGYYYFLREAYSLPGIIRRFRREGSDPDGLAVHFAHYVVSRYGMVKTAHALRMKRPARLPATGSPEAEAPAELQATGSRTGELL